MDDDFDDNDEELQEKRDVEEKQKKQKLKKQKEVEESIGEDSKEQFPANGSLREKSLTGVKHVTVRCRGVQCIGRPLLSSYGDQGWLKTHDCYMQGRAEHRQALLMKTRAG